MSLHSNHAFRYLQCSQELVEEKVVNSDFRKDLIQLFMPINGLFLQNCTLHFMKIISSPYVGLLCVSYVCLPPPSLPTMGSQDF